ncbi:flagellar hook protein FlgE [Massilia glaciei]|uniref:Flagellar hook protein FlgE n=1 Tax=Massilia glaciei TaxID=1524097 RepID=A0A2U2HGN4_9BURK|nr:flagellar hook protein FlgE [Massilia glaciei]PWF44353.1 flagellar hook protein FlgE [Massilia glaciei]
MSFQQGLSGLNGAAKSLDVIGNNIANASTVGFKTSQAQFADVYANSLSGAAGNQAGIGVKVSQIAQQFNQGNIEASNNPLDIAINGSGFFRTTVNGAVQYARNGQFALNKDGFITNAQGAMLTGYMAGPTGAISAGSPVPLQISTANLQPLATSRIDTELNLDSASVTPLVTPFNPNNSDTYNKQTAIDVYDSLGTPHVVTSYFVKSAPGVWDVYVANDGTEITNLEVASASHDPSPAAATSVTRQEWVNAMAAVPRDPARVNLAAQNYATAAGDAVEQAAAAAGASATDVAAINTAATTAGNTVGFTPEQIDAAITAAVRVPPVSVGQLKFDSSGALSPALMAPQTLPFSVALPMYPSTGAADTLTVDLGFAGTTQYGSATREKLSQDGYASGQLQRFAAGADGVIMGQYSNGRSQALGQIVLSNFANPNGLTPLGNNAWAESSTSGVPLTGTPDSGGRGVLQSAAVETSNVDLTAELVNMITAQRVYQANAQTIKTQDSILQTLVNLR